MQNMPEPWAALWRASLSAPDASAACRDVIGKIIAAHNEGKLGLLSAGRLLTPLLGHPVANQRRWYSPEFFMIGFEADGIYGDRMTRQDDVRHWEEIEACYRRLILNAASDEGAPGRR